MKMPRMTSAMHDADEQHAVLVLGGTANAAMMMTKTNRLSTDSEYSVM